MLAAHHGRRHCLPYQGSMPFDLMTGAAAGPVTNLISSMATSGGAAFVLAAAVNSTGDWISAGIGPTMSRPLVAIIVAIAVTPISALPTDETIKSIIISESDAAGFNSLKQMAFDQVAAAVPEPS